MKVFISWSGKLSQEIAKEVKIWVEQCIQSVEAFFSTEDIAKGDAWNAKLTSELRETNFGIVCLTSENIDAPWLHFEAGALFKQLDSKVATLAVNVSFTNIQGPLSSFQATKLEKDDMYGLIQSVNSCQERPLTEEKLKTTFNAFWDGFKQKVDEIINGYKQKNGVTPARPKINVEQSVEEILNIVRSQNAIINNPTKLFPIDFLDTISERINSGSGSDTDYIFDQLYDFSRFLLSRIMEEKDQDYSFLLPSFKNFLMDISARDTKWRGRFRHLLYKFDMANKMSL